MSAKRRSWMNFMGYEEDGLGELQEIQSVCYTLGIVTGEIEVEERQTIYGKAKYYSLPIYVNTEMYDHLNLVKEMIERKNRR